MNILLVRGPLTLSKYASAAPAVPPIGMAYIAGALIKDNHKVKVIDVIGQAINEYYPYEEKTRLRIRKLKEKIEKVLDLKNYKNEMDNLEKEITFLHFKSINLILEKFKISKSEVTLAGFHGHTIFHSFQDKKSKQLGDGRALSKLIDLNIIYNFRANDLKNGGQGAPLVPIFHKLLQKKLQLKTPVVFVNISRDIETGNPPGNLVLLSFILHVLLTNARRIEIVFSQKSLMINV